MDTSTTFTTGQLYNNLFLTPHAEGYVNATQNGAGYDYKYVFNYTDHLGNIRLSYAEDPTSKVLKIIEENHYYPFGLKHSGYNSDKMMYVREALVLKIKPVTPFLKTSYDYKYNGKEWQDELGLNMYDYGARNYDPALGRWMNIDPLAETSRRWTPYNYAYNNPMYFVDPDGMEAEASQTANIYYDWDKKMYINKSTGNESTIDEALNNNDEDNKNNNSGYVFRKAHWYTPWLLDSEYTKKSKVGISKADYTKKSIKSSGYKKDDGVTKLLQGTLSGYVGLGASSALIILDGVGILSTSSEFSLSLGIGSGILSSFGSFSDWEYQVNYETTSVPVENWYGKVRYNTITGKFNAVDYYSSDNSNYIIQIKKYERIINSKTNKIIKENCYTSTNNIPTSSTFLPPKKDIGTFN